jgi:hypothetical protein
MNVEVLVKKTVLIDQNSVHINVFPAASVKTALYVKLIIKVNVFHVPSVPVESMNILTIVGLPVLIRVKIDLNRAPNNVYLIASAITVLFV